MQVFLHNLGHKQQIILLKKRAARINNPSGQHTAGGSSTISPTNEDGQARRLGWLGRLWVHGTGIAPEVAALGINVIRERSYGVMGSMVVCSGMFGLLAVSMACCGNSLAEVTIGVFAPLMTAMGFWIPKSWLRQICHSPVTVVEVETLHATTKDKLERAYLWLVADAVRQEAEPETADRVRKALQAIGEAIGRLPAMSTPRASVEALYAEAIQIEETACYETDPVIVASHERRADALRRSASSAQRSQTLMRRAAALREEMLAQIESLRLGLTNFEADTGEIGSLDSLADAVRVVATEAFAAADARSELDRALSDVMPLPSMPPENGSQELRMGNQSEGIN